MDNLHWTVLVLTCSTSKKAAAFKTELLLLQKKGLIDPRTALLTVEDPEKDIGSGGATLNALLVVIEFLSAKRGFSVLNSDVLVDSSILIIHNGRLYPFDICNKGFIPFPELNNGEGPFTNVHNYLQIMGRLLKNSRRLSGVWVCSTDAYLDGELPPLLHPGGVIDGDCVIFSVPASPEYATSHGVLQLESSSCTVSDILYCRPLEDLLTCCMPDGRVPVVCGMAYLSPALAESLLSLHSRTPISSCTYLGQDNGSDSLQISLFFDLLSAMASGVTESHFLAGECGKTYGTYHAFPVASAEISTFVRSCVWKELRRYKMTTVVLNEMEHHYWNEKLPVLSHLRMMQMIYERKGLHSFPVGCHSLVTPIASSMRHVITRQDHFDGPKLSCVIQHSILHGTNEWPITVGCSSFISSIAVDTAKLQSSVNFANGIAYIEVGLSPRSKLHKPSTVLLHFGIMDELYVPFEDSTFYNVPWQAFFLATGVTPDDLWNKALVNSKRCLANAMLFPLNENILQIWWMKDVNSDLSESLNRWRNCARISIMESIDGADLDVEFSCRRDSIAAVAQQKTRDILLGRSDGSPLPSFVLAATEGWSTFMFDTLDNLLLDSQQAIDKGTAARILANVANLLGILADGEGGLRSGPAANREWRDALEMFESNYEDSIPRGVRMLKMVRNQWLDTPHRLVRAARHYEGASQILVRQAVTTAKQFVTPRRSPLPDIGVWVSCQCSARVDLAGGWTDTPPICYQLGGSVINASIMVNGKRPIGVKVCRIEEPEIQCSLDDNVVLRLTQVAHVLDYNIPSSAGALVKACLVYSEVVDIGNEHKELAKQLMCNWGGGLKIETCSTLPQGSGLGTSSIMAGAILAAIYLATGRQLDRASLIHAVLCVEQLMTTGGGWQDQVGGLMGGILHAQSPPSLPLRVITEKLQLSQTFLATLEKHLVLIHTGKVRLAKNLLQNVLRNWFARDQLVIDTFRNLLHLTTQLKDALNAENLSGIGNVMNEYWRLKKTLAPSAEPSQVGKVMEHLRPHVHGQLLCGAGGGGFMLVLTKQPDTQEFIYGIIGEMQIFGFTLYSVNFDPIGMEVKVGEVVLDVD